MSSGGKRIAIVHFGDRDLDARSYFIRVLRPEWEAAGWSVVALDNSRRFVPADIAVSHVDRTKVPERIQSLLARYPRVVNGRLNDISKSRVTRLAVTETDGWDGPVIVKTERNCSGAPERNHLAARLGLGFKPLVDRVADRIRRWQARNGIDPFRPYPVFSRLADVPERMRRNPELVVQRFLPERDGDLYVMHMLTFCGDHGVSVRTRSTEPVVKARGFVDVSIVDVPPGLIAEVRALGADYGKVDYVMHHGRPVILDVNRAPTFAGPEPNERHRFVARTIARGIEEFG